MSLSTEKSIQSLRPLLLCRRNREIEPSRSHFLTTLDILGPHRFVSGKMVEDVETELRRLMIFLISAFSRRSESNTTVEKSSSFIAGKRMALTISSPSILLFTEPSAVKRCRSHSFVAHRSTALNNSISSIVSVSLLTTVSSSDLSISPNPSDFTASSVCLSITFQHRSTRFFSSYFSADGRMLKTFDGSKLSSKYSEHLSTSDGTMYFFAKYNNPITLLPLKSTSSLYMKRKNSNRLS